VNFYILLEKSEKSRYLCNSTTDLHNIWHDDAERVSEVRRQLKEFYFKNPRWVTASMLETYSASS